MSFTPAVDSVDAVNAAPAPDRLQRGVLWFGCNCRHLLFMRLKL